jgi:hypothetical protein
MPFHQKPDTLLNALNAHAVYSCYSKGYTEHHRLASCFDHTSIHSRFITNRKEPKVHHHTVWLLCISIANAMKRGPWCMVVHFSFRCGWRVMNRESIGE